MARRGVRQGEPKYDPAWGQPYRLTIMLTPSEAVKVIQAGRCANLSLSGLIGELVERMPVTDDGCPTWVAEIEREVTDQLPLASGG